MKVLRILMFAALGAFLMTACSDDNGPELTVNLSSDTISVGDVVTVTATATDDVGIVSLTFVSADLGLNDTVPVASEVSISQGLEITINEGTPPGDYEMEITATDTDGNTASEKVSMTIE